MYEYECFAIRSRGYNHIINDLVCQDSSGCICEGKVSVISVADGHGSPQYFRSDRGSKFAVSCALNKMKEFVEKISLDDIRTEKESLDKVSQLVKSIIIEWHRCVKNDYIQEPFSDEELSKVPEKYIGLYRSGNKPEKAYGSTLIAVADNGSYCIGIHIGDGKCIALYEDGTTDEPIPWDENCHLNKCTSICDSKAAEEFRFYIWKEKHPAAILICSDGIEDSCGSFLHDYFKSVLAELTDGDFHGNVEKFKNDLPALSQCGSKDDVSLAGLVDVKKIAAMRTLLEADAELAKSERSVMNAENKISDLTFLYNKAKKIYDKCTEHCTDINELNEKREKLLDAQKSLDEARIQAAEYKKQYEEAVIKRKKITENHITAAVCPECGHPINIECNIEIS